MPLFLILIVVQRRDSSSNREKGGSHELSVDGADGQPTDDPTTRKINDLSSLHIGTGSNLIRYKNWQGAILVPSPNLKTLEAILVLGHNTSRY